MKRKNRDHLLLSTLICLTTQTSQVARQQLADIGSRLVGNYKKEKRKKVEKEILNVNRNAERIIN